MDPLNIPKPQILVNFASNFELMAVKVRAARQDGESDKYLCPETSSLASLSLEIQQVSLFFSYLAFPFSK